MQGTGWAPHASSLGIPRFLWCLGQSLPSFGSAPGISVPRFPQMAATMGWHGMGWGFPLHSARAAHIGSPFDPPSFSSMLAFLFQVEIYFKTQQIYFASGPIDFACLDIAPTPAEWCLSPARCCWCSWTGGRANVCCLPLPVPAGLWTLLFMMMM